MTRRSKKTQQQQLPLAPAMPTEHQQMPPTAPAPTIAAEPSAASAAPAPVAANTTTATSEPQPRSSKTKKKKKKKSKPQSAAQSTSDAVVPSAAMPASCSEPAASSASVLVESSDAAAAAQPSRRSIKKKNWRQQKQEKKQAAQQQRQEPAAAAAVKTPKKPAAVVFPEFPAEEPAMGFAAPHTQLSSDVRAFIDGVIDAASKDAARAHLVAHMRRGLEQIEAFMQLQHTDAEGNAVRDFEAAVARDSELWAQHVANARASEDMGVQDRTLQPSLRVALAGMDLKAGRPGRPDDAVYAKSEYARQFMPRGNFVAAWRSPTSGAMLHFPVVRAYRKFTGQEDDGEQRGALDADELSKFFTKPKEQARTVICTEKENGEAAHLAVLKRADGAYLFAVGSKNTHLITLSLDDVEAACAAGCAGSGGNDPYKAAAPLARALLGMLAQLAPAHRAWLCEFLWQTRLTASFEVLCPDHQHVQLLDYLGGADTPVFYGVSLPALPSTRVRGAEICVNPVLPLELLRALSVRTVAYDVVAFAPAAYDAALRSVKTRHAHEGAVNLFVDDAACVIGLEKFKTVWYVSLRAIREKAKAFCNKLHPSGRRRAQAAGQKTQTAQTRAQVLAESQTQISKRFVAIRSFVQVSPDVASAYAALGHRFVEYLSAEKLADGTSADEVARVKRNVAELFPVVWQQFLAHSGLSDVIEA